MYTALEAKKDQLLIHAIVLLRDIGQIYEFPRVKAVVAQYDQLVKDMNEQVALDEEAKRCEERNIRKGVIDEHRCPSCFDTLQGMMSRESDTMLRCDACGYGISE